MTISVPIGNLVDISTIFQHNGADADPTGVTFKVVDTVSRAVIASYVYGVDAALIRDSQGHYHVDYLTAVVGDLTLGYIGTGAVEAHCDDRLIVTDSPLYDPTCP